MTLEHCSVDDCVYRFICVNNSHEGRKPKALVPETRRRRDGSVFCKTKVRTPVLEGDDEWTC